MAENEMSRRGFLKGLVVMVTAGAATGGGAAALMKLRKGETVFETMGPTPPVVNVPTTAPVQTNAGNNDLLARLAEAQAENLRLRAELTATQNRLQALEAANGDASQVNAALQAELTNAQNQVGLLAGLVALYEQLEQVDLADVVGNGIAAVGEAWNDLTGRVPGLEEGLSLGSLVLDDFERQIPLVAAGRTWVDLHLARLELLFQTSQQVLSAVLETAGDFFSLLAAWFADVLKWVPFGMGDKASSVITALTDLLQETPQTISGLHSNVLDPLNPWLEKQGDEVALQSKLVKPLRENALNPAVEVAGKVRQTHETYVAQLAEPAQQLVNQRQTMQELIRQYREKHQV